MAGRHNPFIIELAEREGYRRIISGSRQLGWLIWPAEHPMDEVLRADFERTFTRQPVLKTREVYTIRHASPHLEQQIYSAPIAQPLALWKEWQIFPTDKRDFQSTGRRKGDYGKHPRFYKEAYDALLLELQEGAIEDRLTRRQVVELAQERDVVEMEVRRQGERLEEVFARYEEILKVWVYESTKSSVMREGQDAPQSEGLNQTFAFDASLVWTRLLLGVDPETELVIHGGGLSNLLEIKLHHEFLPRIVSASQINGILFHTAARDLILADMVSIDARRLALEVAIHHGIRGEVLPEFSRIPQTSSGPSMDSAVLQDGGESDETLKKILLKPYTRKQYIYDVLKPDSRTWNECNQKLGELCDRLGIRGAVEGLPYEDGESMRQAVNRWAKNNRKKIRAMK